MSDNFRYCPKCGAAALKPDSAKSVFCSACGFVYYFNVAAAVAGLIVNEKNELLVAVRGREPGKGMWDLPGGFVDAGESAEDALRREIKEELNLDVESLEYIASFPNTYHYKNVTYPTCDLAYICHVSDFSTLTARSDIETALFVAPESIDTSKFAFDSIRQFVKLFIQTKS